MALSFLVRRAASKLLETIKELASRNHRHGGLRQRPLSGADAFLPMVVEFLLINPRFVKPFVKGSKNDAADAEGIYEAALRPTMRFVPVKSTEQQDLQSLHRARERVVCARTALINHMRGLLGEYGVILPQGAWRFLAQAQDAIAAADLSDLARALFSRPARRTPRSRSPARQARPTAPTPFAGQTKPVGGSRSCQASVPVIATALVAAVDDGRHFRSGRELAAWIGLVPRQYTTRRQTPARRDWKARQSLSPTPNDPWRPRGDVSIGEARRSSFPVAERARGEAGLQSGDCRARQ